MLLPGVMPHGARHLRRNRLNVIPDVAIQPLVIDQHPVVIFGKPVAHHRRKHVYVAVRQHRRLGVARKPLLHLAPFVEQQPQVRVERFGVFPLGHGAHNQAYARRNQAFGQRLEAAALLVGMNLLRHRHIVSERNQDQKTPGHGYVRGNAAALGRNRLLDYLDQNPLIGFQGFFRRRGGAAALVRFSGQALREAAAGANFHAPLEGSLVVTAPGRATVAVRFAARPPFSRRLAISIHRARNIRLLRRHEFEQLPEVVRQIGKM